MMNTNMIYKTISLLKKEKRNNDYFNLKNGGTRARECIINAEKENHKKSENKVKHIDKEQLKKKF